MNEATRNKFSDEQIKNLFAMFNEDSCIKNIGGFYGDNLHATKPEWFSRLNYDNLTSKKFNAYACVDVGHVYENFGKGEAGRSDEERLADGIDKIMKMKSAMERICAASDNPLYNSLKIDIVTKEFHLCRTKIDHGDDGDDHYGVEVFFKIHF